MSIYVSVFAKLYTGVPCFPEDRALRLAFSGQPTRILKGAPQIVKRGLKEPV